jgi:hypothetical protein
VIIQEQFYPHRTAELVAQKAGAKLLVLSGGTNFRLGQTYEQRMEVMVQKLVSALRGRKGT